MSDMQKFDDNIIENLRMFSFKDDEQFYTNGVELVPLYRVVQILEHFKVQELVDKETPKKPKNVSEYSSDEWCPNCHSFNIETRDEEGSWQKWDYCPDCGQALDWSNDE